MKKFGLLLAAVSLLVLVVSGVSAQDQTFGLSESDYALYQAANANSAEFDSLGYEFIASLNLSGAGEAPVTAVLNGSGVIGEDAGAPLFSMVVTGELNSGTETLPADLEVRLVGDTLYFRQGEEWTGSTLDSLIESFGAGLGGVIPGMEGGVDGAMEDPMGALPPEAMGAMMGLATLDPSEFVSISRTDDGGMAVFTASIDVQAFLSSEEIAPLLGMGMAQGMGMGDTEMTEEEVQQMAMMVSMLFSDATVEVVQTVNPETELIERTVLTVDLSLAGMSEQPVDILLTFDIELAYDVPVEIIAPEGVEVAS